LGGNFISKLENLSLILLQLKKYIYFKELQEPISSIEERNLLQSSRIYFFNGRDKLFQSLRIYFFD